MPPPPEDPTIDRVLSERPDQRFIGDRDLTAWPTTTGTALARLARSLRRRLAPHNVLIIILVVGLGMVAAMTAAAGAVYDAVTEHPDRGLRRVVHPHDGAHPRLPRASLAHR